MALDMIDPTMRSAAPAQAFPIDAVRSQFPALDRRVDGRQLVYFDAPGGTQTCRMAIERMVEHLEAGTANAGGAFVTSRETDAMSDAAHAAMADLLGGRPEEIAFGPNMTSLTFAVSRALAQKWSTEDQIILTRLDHDANVTPWVLAAQDSGATVRWLDIDPATGTLRLDELPGLLSAKTRLVAFGGASNAIGTLNDVNAITAMVRERSDALTFVDAVQSVPHVPTDVEALGCDLLACSPYKFFGPHQGVLWGRAEVLAGLTAYKVRPARSLPAATRFETGTPSFEGQAGVLGTIEYLDWLGRKCGATDDADRRATLTAAMARCVEYENALGTKLLAALAEVPGLRLFGPPTMAGRVPTFAFGIDGHAPQAIAEHLARDGINAWAGHFYALEPIARLGVAESGGLLRVGLCHYCTEAEVDRLGASLLSLVG